MKPGYWGSGFRNLVLCFLCVALCGCSTSWRNGSQDGAEDTQKSENEEETTYTVDCSWAVSDIGYCLDEGNRICGELGYEIIGGNPANIPDYDTWDFGLFDVPGISRQIVIRCLKPGQVTLAEAPVQPETPQATPEPVRGQPAATPVQPESAQAAEMPDN